MATKTPKSDQRLAFAFGVAFLVVILGMAIFRPEPTPFEYTVFRITLALAAGGVGAVLPGFLHVQFGSWVRAGGALALFLIVYLVSPVAVADPVDPNPRESRNNPLPVARSWLELVDGKRLDDAYSATDPMFKARFAKDAMISILAPERTALGALVARRFTLDQPLINPPGMTPGAYRWIGFVTKFKNERRPIYEAVQLHADAGAWKVVGFSTSIRTAAGAYVLYEPEDGVEPSNGSE